MKKLNFVTFLIIDIFIFSNIAFGKAPSTEFRTWSQAAVQSVSGKTLFEICQKRRICEDISKEILSEKATFKITHQTESTLLMSYKKKFVKIGHLKNSTIFTINKKTLDLSQVKDIKDLNQKIVERLPRFAQTAQHRFSWINFALAEMPLPSQLDIATPLTLLILANQEAEICQLTQTIAFKCEQFGKDYDAFEKTAARITSPQYADGKSKRDLLLRDKLVYGEIRPIYGLASHLSSLFSSLVPQKIELMNRCECSGSDCKLGQAKADASKIGKAVSSCIIQLNDIKKQFGPGDELDAKIDGILAALEESDTESPPAPPTSPTGPSSEKGFTTNSGRQ
jgi:hypothetical protein